MYKIRAFKELNAVLGMLNGTLTVDELNTYGNELVRSIEQKMMPNFSYIMDVKRWGVDPSEGVNAAKEKIHEIEFFLSKMGLKYILIIGNDDNTSVSYKAMALDKPQGIERLYFSTLDETINYLVKENKE